MSEWWHVDPMSQPSIFDYVAMGLTVIGFAIAIIQVTRTRRLQAATAQTEEDTSTALMQNQINSYVAELQSAIADLDHAVSVRNDELGARTLARYATVSASAATLMRKMNDAETSVPERLEASARGASAAKEELVMGRLRLKASVVDLYSDLSDISVWAARTNTELIFTVPKHGTKAAKIRKGK